MPNLDPISRHLYNEAAELRRWADAHLADRERMAPYDQAMRLEQLARRLQERLQGGRPGVRETVRKLAASVRDVWRVLQREASRAPT